MEYGSSPRRGSAVERCVTEIRRAIVEGDLTPGQAIPQDRLARQVGTSHIPLREALRVLESQGLLRHVRNIGYAVADLDADELKQIHIMRRALETEVLRTVPRLTVEVAAALREINASMTAAVLSEDTASATRLNKDFHFLLFAQSHLRLVVAELDRLWVISDIYRTMYLWRSHMDRTIISEHEDMVKLASRGDSQRLVHLMDRHRDRSLQTVSPHLRSRGGEEKESALTNGRTERRK